MKSQVLKTLREQVKELKLDETDPRYNALKRVETRVGVNHTSSEQEK